MRDVLQRLASQVKLSVVVPCYNEVGNIGELHKRVSAACEKSVGSSYELVLVNDGSRDETWNEIATLHFSDEHVVAVNLSRNYGHQVALSAGLSVCLGERVLILDADLQDPPELLSGMMEAIDRGADVAYGVRSERLGESWFKRASAKFFYRLLAHVVDIEIPTDTGDFRLMTRRAVDILVDMPEQHRFIRGMVSWIGLKQTPIMYQRQPRYFGVTKYPLTKMVRFALDAITGFSIRPLRIASYFGLISGFSAVILLSHVLYLWALGDTVEGWTSIVSVMLLLGAAQLFVIGIIGEYLGRLYMEAKGRPLFVVQDLLRAHRTIAPAHAGKKAKVPASTLVSAD
jgi:dolichol-phosphate mannosyltransferase